MKLANGRDVTVGDLVVARDTGGNLVAGQVMQVLERPNAVRLLGAPMLVQSEKALLVEDAYGLALQVPELTTALATATSRVEDLAVQLTHAVGQVEELKAQVAAAAAERASWTKVAVMATGPENQTTPTEPTNPTAIPAPAAPADNPS